MALQSAGSLSDMPTLIQTALYYQRTDKVSVRCVGTTEKELCKNDLKKRV